MEREKLDRYYWLVDELNRHGRLYYVLDAPEIEDDEYARCFSSKGNIPT